MEIELPRTTDCYTIFIFTFRTFQFRALTGVMDEKNGLAALKCEGHNGVWWKFRLESWWKLNSAVILHLVYSVGPSSWAEFRVYGQYLVAGWGLGVQRLEKGNYGRVPPFEMGRQAKVKSTLLGGLTLGCLWVQFPKFATGSWRGA